MNSFTIQDEDMRRLDDALTEVMKRFRNYFLGPGVNMAEENVPFRRREDFSAPLVTVMGHTYGVRLALDEERRSLGKPHLAVEVSANVYADEFDLEQTRRRLRSAYRPGTFEKTVSNFMTPEDEVHSRKDGLKVFASVFSFDVQQDIDLVEKPKETASKVTGRFVDMILRMKYWVEPRSVHRLMKDPRLFESSVYLYCLRVFMAACREFLMGGGRAGR